MKKAIIIAIFFSVIYIPAKTVYAGGTAAGTNITNKAIENFILAGSGVSVDSNITLDKVAELIDVAVTWQDASNILASQGDSNKAVTFKVTHPGNGTETFALSVNVAVAGDNFDPLPTGVYLDTNNNGTYDAGTDPLYVAGTNDPVLSADASINVFVLCNIPAGLSDGATGIVQLTATSKTGTGAVGTVFSNAGDGGGDAVIGPTGGTATQAAKYLITGGSATELSIVKTAVVIDQSGGKKAVSGSTIRYTLVVTVTGSGTASGVVITDPIPETTTYEAGTLALDGTALTDAIDTDAGDVGGTTAGTLTVGLGDLTSVSPPRAITFEVNIK